MPAVSRPSRQQVLIAAACASSAAVVLEIAALSTLSAPVREQVSSTCLALAGLVAAVACTSRARSLVAVRALPWWLLGLAATTALAGNVASSLVTPSAATLVSDATIAAALLLSITALVLLARFFNRGLGLLRMLLDGLVVGGALLVLLTSVVFPGLLAGPADRSPLATLAAVAFPVLDVVVVAAATLVFLRSPRERRLMLGLLAGGFAVYAVADLVYAVRSAQATFVFGEPSDVGWVAGYLLIACAALTRTDPAPSSAVAAGGDRSEVNGTVFVLGLAVLAVVVQSVAAHEGGIAVAERVLLVIVLAAAGARQVALSWDNLALRRSLEERVRVRTADLRSLVNQHDALLTSVADGIYGLDFEGRVVFANPAAARLLGCTPDELVETMAHEVFHAPDDGDVEHAWARCPARLAMTGSGESTAREELYRRLDGSTFPVESTTAPLITDDGVHGAVVVFREITERREVERLKNEFLSVVSHELRTPLTAILGSLELVSSGSLGELPPDVDRLVAVASRSSQRLARLINDLLDFERIESGRQPLNLVRRPARELVALAVQQVHGLALHTEVEIAVGVVEGHVNADEDQVVQTLVNLLGNAVKFSPFGGRVEVRARRQGGDVVFEVRDHGRGIPADKLELIFDRFSQVDSSDARALGGTGLGLAISKSIVTRHGGTIWATSKPGLETVLAFRLPSADRTGVESSTSTVVLVTAEQDAARYLPVLRQGGRRVVRVDDAAALARVVGSQQPSLVVVDLASAVGVTAADLAALDRGDVPLLVISDRPGDTAAVAPGDAWLVEPGTEEELAALVARVLRERGDRVLLVEDDPELAAVVVALLAADGVRVQHASTAAEAREVQRVEDVDVLVLDLMLPDGEGSEVLADYRRRGVLDDASLVVFSALPPPASGEAELGEDVYLQKSRSGADELRAQVLALLAQRAPTAPSPTRPSADAARGAPSSP